MGNILTFRATWVGWKATWVGWNMTTMNYYSTLRYAALVVGLLFAMTRDAQSYTDPGSTSYFFQLIIAGLTAVVFFFSSLKRRGADFYKAVFKKNGSKPDAKLAPDKSTLSKP